VRQKIRWSPQPSKLACRRKIGATSSYRGALLRWQSASVSRNVCRHVGDGVVVGRDAN
jgi:hypothetical protein